MARIFETDKDPLHLRMKFISLILASIWNSIKVCRHVWNRMQKNILLKNLGTFIIFFYIHIKKGIMKILDLFFDGFACFGMIWTQFNIFEKCLYVYKFCGNSISKTIARKLINRQFQLHFHIIWNWLCFISTF